MKPNHLLVPEINYELRIRGVITNRDIHDKRKILGKELRREANRNVRIEDPNFVYDTERLEIDATLRSIELLIQEFEGSVTDSAYNRIQSRLIHVSGRIKRMALTDDDGPEAELFKNEAYATCLTLEADLDTRVTVDATQPLTLVNAAPAPTVVTVHEPSKLVDLGRWDIKFDGTRNTVGVKTFLERVDELAEARRVNKKQLFESAVDLFSGDALLWLRHVKKSEAVKDWDGLVTKLEQDFLRKDYDEELWISIKSRKQQESEPVVIFIAVMESLFSCLSTPAAVVTKIKWIQRNLKREYVRQLALNNYQSVEELLKDVKKLEEVLGEDVCRDYSSDRRKSCQELEIDSVPSSSRECTGINEPTKFNFDRKYKKNSNFFHKENYSHGGYNSRVFNNSQNSRNPQRVSREIGVVNTSRTNKDKFQKFRGHSENFPVNNLQPAGISSVQIVPTQGAIKKTNCWNCGRPNHTFRACRQKRGKFCYKCGKPDVITPNCDRCSAGNA